jgi:hypothetical protein
MSYAEHPLPSDIHLAHFQQATCLHPFQGARSNQQHEHLHRGQIWTLGCKRGCAGI